MGACSYCYLLCYSSELSILFYSTTRQPPTSTLFPYTTLFRSRATHSRGLRIRFYRSASLDLRCRPARASGRSRSEEHTSELQSPDHLVCRLLLEKKNGMECYIPDLRLTRTVRSTNGSYSNQVS